MKTLILLLPFCILLISSSLFSQNLTCTHTVSGSPCWQMIELNCTGGTPSYTHEWSNGTFSATNEALLPGEHTVTVTDSNNNQFIETYVLEGDPAAPCDTLFVTPITTTVGDQFRVDFTVEGFVNIWTAIYSHHYDPTLLQYDSVSNFNPLMQNLDVNSFSPPNGGNKIDLLFMPFDPITLPAGDLMYSMYFTPLSTEPTQVTATGPLILIMNNDIQGLHLSTSPASLQANSISDPTIQSQNNIFVYPNPSNNVMTFEIQQWSKDLNLEIYNSAGKLISRKLFQGEQLELSKEMLGEGLYFYNIQSNGELVDAGKFVFY